MHCCGQCQWDCYLQGSGWVVVSGRVCGSDGQAGWESVQRESCDGKTHAERHPGSQAGRQAGRVGVAVGCCGFLCAVVGELWAVVSEVRAQECHGDLYMGVTGTHAGSGILVLPRKMRHSLLSWPIDG